MLSETELELLAAIGGESIEGSGFEFEPEEAEEIAPAPTRVTTAPTAAVAISHPVHAAIGSLHCFEIAHARESEVR